MPKKFEVKPGDVYGQLTVIAEAAPIVYGNKKERRMLCKCSCGNTTETLFASMRSGKCTSCGCAQKQMMSATKTVHGMTGERLHRIWRNMKTRISNPNTDFYKYYGGRGIKMCASWYNDFTVFRDWALLNGYADTLSIERRNNDGDYEPSNCKWATYSEQAYNRRPKGST